MSRGKNDLQYTRSDAMLHGGVLLMKPGFTGNFFVSIFGQGMATKLLYNVHKM